MVHERYVPSTTMKYRAMALWQRPQYRALVRSANVLFCSTEAWISELRGLAPACGTHLAPAGSGIPFLAMDPRAARERLGIDPDDFVLGFFGFAHASKPLGHVRSAAKAVADARKRVKLLYIGSEPDVVRDALPGIEVIAEGALEPDEVSRRFSAMDLLLCPFTDGVATRRTTMMTGLQHRVATLGTIGEYTSEQLARLDGTAMRLVPCDDPEAFARAAADLALDPASRRRIAAEGRSLFEREFAPDVLADRFLDVLANA
jgi:glycosyltransferase involved in cell wall biosynthesis